MKRYALVSLTNITRSEIEAHVPDHYDVLAVLSDLPITASEIDLSHAVMKHIPA